MSHKSGQTGIMVKIVVIFYVSDFPKMKKARICELHFKRKKFTFPELFNNFLSA